MARKPRIHFPDAVYHVILKGLENESIFKNVADRRAWELLVEEGAGRFGHKILAYCWAKDHVQMALQVSDAPLSKVMQNLSFRYTRYFNKAHKRQGPLFHGRYKAILIDQDVYLNDLVRYVHNNPVRSGAAKSADKAKWTSYEGYMGSDDKPWLCTEAVLGSMGKTPKTSKSAFAKFIEAGKSEGVRTDLVRGSEGGRVLGGKRFVAKALKPAKVIPKPMTLNQLVKRICKEESVKESALKNESRARHESRIRQTIAYLAMELNVATLTALAHRFNRDLTTMSRNQRYYRDKLVTDKGLQKHVRALRKNILVA
jgi:putative transposase